jgi:RNA recognition motif-containing protein
MPNESKTRKRSTCSLLIKEKYMYKLFVGGLPFSTTEDELKDAFGAHGTVASAKIITDRDTGRSKGFGFVEFENEDEGKEAEKAMNGSDMGGRSLTVNEARPMEKREPRRDNGGGNRSSW